jgi:DNA-binding beta-propeller fold protein YncE
VATFVLKPCEGSAVLAIDTAIDTTRTTITTRTGPDDIAITPDGAIAYVTAASSRQYMMNVVTPIRTATGTALKGITVGRGPGTAIIITADGKTAYVTNYDSGTVTPIPDRE